MTVLTLQETLVQFSSQTKAEGILRSEETAISISSE
jgi:hypothetical protein